jgi:hypothetical protein
MRIDRRVLLGALGLGVAAGASQAKAQEQTASTASQPGLADRIAARAAENRHRLDYDGARFSGAAWEMMLQEGRGSHFFCIGEEHGIAENPRLAAQLFSALAPSGYSKACVEISPPMAAELDRAARDGVDGLRALFADPGANVAFFGMREEAEWLASARASAPRRGQAIWGLDYEVGADRRIIQRLRAQRKPAAAAVALAALEAASNASWAQYDATRGPQHIFSFSGDPALVRAVRDAWPNPDAEASWMLETLEETLAINRLWTSNQGWASNDRRAQFNRRNLRRYWVSEEGRNPKVMFKFGASHMVRGLSHTQVFDIGAQISELAGSLGARSFHVMVLPGAGSQQAQFDPSAWTYRPSDAGTYEDQGMTPLLSAAYADAFTLIDLRPIRPLVFGARHKALDADLVRTIHGFDALLVMTGSTPSANL